MECDFVHHDNNKDGSGDGCYMDIVGVGCHWKEKSNLILEFVNDELYFVEFENLPWIAELSSSWNNILT